MLSTVQESPHKKLQTISQRLFSAIPALFSAIPALVQRYPSACSALSQRLFSTYPDALTASFPLAGACNTYSGTHR